MGISRVHLRDRYIDTNDACMEVWLRLLVSAIESTHDKPAWLVAAAAEWNEVATMGHGFGVIPDLDNVITDESRRDTVLRLAEAAARRLRELGDPIPAAVLNQLGAGPVDSSFTRDVPAAMFQEVADDFIRLVREAPL
ncbi:MAG: hypothetical protein KC464_23565 [Myxococcales bacterium]|nr:hypothetical protein [Myxococcales bacterium]